MKKIIFASILMLCATTGVAFAQQGVPASAQKNANTASEKNDVRTQNKKGTTTAELHRSEVAKFVQTLLSSSTRIGGIGEQVRLIAQEQASSTEKTVVAIERVEQRSKLKTFIIGADYENLGTIRSELVTMQNRIQRLSAEAERMASSTDRSTLIQEIVALGEGRLKLETFVKDNENVFSLFGWVRKIFK